MKILLFVIDALAAFRLTWLVTEDYLTMGIRQRLIRFGYRTKYSKAKLAEIMDNVREHAGVNFEEHPDAWEQVVENDHKPPRLAMIWTCPWCAGVWVAAGVVAMRHAAAGVWGPTAQALAIAGVLAIVADYVDKQHSQ